MSACKRSAKRTWYAVQCKVRQEERAEENLLRQGYLCFRPIYKYRRMLRGENVLVEESLFPGYLFVNLAPEDSWVTLRYTRGVTRIVSFGDRPLAVDDAIMAQLQNHQEAPYLANQLAVGQQVTINTGPFAKVEATFLSMDGGERVVLLMNLLHRQQKVRVPLLSVSNL